MHCKANVPPALSAGVQEKPLRTQTHKQNVHFLWIRPLALIASYNVGQLRMSWQDEDLSQLIWSSERWCLLCRRLPFTHLAEKMGKSLNTSSKKCSFYTGWKVKAEDQKVPLWPRLSLSNKINYSLSTCLSFGKINTNKYRSRIARRESLRYASPPRAPLLLSKIDPLHLQSTSRSKLS